MQQHTDKLVMRKQLLASAIAEQLRLVGVREAELQLFLADCEHPAVQTNDTDETGWLTHIFEQFYSQPTLELRLQTAWSEIEAWRWVKSCRPPVEIELSFHDQLVARAFYNLDHGCYTRSWLWIQAARIVFELTHIRRN